MKNIFILFLAFISFAPSTRAQTITDSLQAYYPFNGNANDESVNNNNGTVNAPTLIADRFSNANSAYNFNGTSDYISINNTLGNFGTSDFSVSFWVKHTGTSFTRFIGKRPSCTNDNLWDIAITTNGVIRWVVNELGGVNFIENYSNQIVNNGNWHHVVCIRAGATLKTYIDNMLDSTSVGTGVANLNNTTDLEFGRSTCIGVDGTVIYTGGLDDIRIYNRALSDQEIGILFNLLPVGVESIAKSNAIKVYPNPSPDFFTIVNNDFQSEKLNLSITDLSGRLVFKRPFHSKEIQLSRSQLGNNGMYFIKITDNQNRLKLLEKIVLN